MLLWGPRCLQSNLVFPLLGWGQGAAQHWLRASQPRSKVAIDRFLQQLLDFAPGQGGWKGEMGELA